MAQVTEYFDSHLLPSDGRRASLTKDEEQAIYNDEATSIGAAETCVAAVTQFSP